MDQPDDRKMRKETRELEKKGLDPMGQLHHWGVRSSHMHMLAIASIGVSLISWVASRSKGDGKPQADRWGIFVGQWAPTLFAIGIGLKQEEQAGLLDK